MRKISFLFLLLVSMPLYIAAQTTIPNEVKFAENKTKGEQFLATNKLKEGVITLPSGLQYKVIRMGKGDKPVASNKVTVNYVGTFINGNKFESTLDNGEPATFPVNRVIPGWTEILKLMPVGSKWIVYIPYSLAYGNQYVGGIIPPYSTLIFELDLLSMSE